MSRLLPPEPVDLVPASEVRSIIASTDRELAVLERTAIETRTAADRDEQRAHDLGVDGRASTWAMVRLQRFLDGLRSEAERDADDVLTIAHERARARLGSARAEAAARHRSRTASEDAQASVHRAIDRSSDENAFLREMDSDRWAKDADETFRSWVAYTPNGQDSTDRGEVAEEVGPTSEPERDTIWDRDAHESPDTAMSGIVDAPEPVVDTADEGEPIEREATPEPMAPPVPISVLFAGEATATALPHEDPPVAAGAPVAKARRAEAHADVAVMADSTLVPVEPLGNDPNQELSRRESAGMTSNPSPTMTDPIAEPAAVPSDTEFWPEETSTARKSWIRRIPVSAVLEVLAVILILVFILLRLS